MLLYLRIQKHNFKNKVQFKNIMILVRNLDSISLYQKKILKKDA